LKTQLNLDSVIGSSFGKGFCGMVGCDLRGEYAILGPAVNLAARLMSHKMNPGILVDLAVKLKAGDFPFEALSPVEAKGYSHPVQIFKPLEATRKDWNDLNSQFFGREMEVESLKQAAERVIQADLPSKFVFVTAPHGIGKNALLAHATEQIENLCRKLGAKSHVSRHAFCNDDAFKPFRYVVLWLHGSETLRASLDHSLSSTKTSLP